MRISRIRLENWKNFREVDVEVHDRVFLVGPNACGKSNFLDAIRFLRDLTPTGGGFQRACDRRGGVSSIRCLAARTRPNISLRVEFRDKANTQWLYELAFTTEGRPSQKARIAREIAERNGERVVERPDAQDERDEWRLSQTVLEQVFANEKIRDIVGSFESISYLHLVPQLIRGANDITVQGESFAPYGYDFLKRVAETHKGTREARMRRIQSALERIVPQLTELTLQTDGGVPHFQARYRHWRPRGAIQTEAHFSDGTLRLIGLLWALQESDGPMLLEEPELSLHLGVVRRLPDFLYGVQRARRGPLRQVFISTHSADMLSDQGISGNEVLLLRPVQEGTEVVVAGDVREVRALLDEGMSVGDVVMAHTEPQDVERLLLPVK
jgi:predicted ATPase